MNGLCFIGFKDIVEVLNNIAAHDWYDYLTLFLTILAIVVNVIVTIINIRQVNENTNKQIENQNKETYKPRLRVKSVQHTNKDITERYLYAHSLGFQENKESIYLYFDIELENIGYGIANDLSFYMLNSGYKCYGTQINERTINQKLSSTIEVPKGEKEIIKFGINFNKELLESKTDGFENDDVVLLICNYKDLNNNNYKILIGCILKRYEGIKTEYSSDDDIKILTDINFDFYYYQEDTKSYNGMIKKDKYIDNYKKIIEEINSK